MSTAENQQIELNEQFRHALRLMEETDRNVFVTGRAGTGKSTLLQYFREHTEKDIVVLAPTGVAAVNVKGQTIHSFFNFRIDITPDTVRKVRPRDKDVYKKLDAIVIDEISMVRADLLDCTDIFLRKFGKKKKSPFGGIQMIFIGDLYQLPPVVTSREKELFRDHYTSPYFFSAKVFEENLFTATLQDEAPHEMELIELEKVYRQKDDAFLDILNAIRNNSVSDSDMETLNARVKSDFKERRGGMYIYLTTTNASADAVNFEKLSALEGDAFHYQGSLEGDFESRALPTLLDLTLKKGAQVMLLNNDSLGRWINGSIGTIADIDEQEDGPDVVWITLTDGEVIDVRPHEWEMYEFSYDKDAASIVSESIGSFIQYPLKLAWAVTIHKSQGLTFDRVVIDLGRGTFSHGQLYVALSRCTTMNGLILKKPVQKRNVLLDRRVVAFVTQYQYRQAQKYFPLEERLRLLEHAVKEKKELAITYLKTKDEKSRRTILPTFVGELEYRGKKFPGVQAFCTSRKDERVFHIERILEIEPVNSDMGT